MSACLLSMGLTTVLARTLKQYLRIGFLFSMSSVPSLLYTVTVLLCRMVGVLALTMSHQGARRMAQVRLPTSDCKTFIRVHGGSVNVSICLNQAEFGCIAHALLRQLQFIKHC